MDFDANRMENLVSVYKLLTTELGKMSFIKEAAATYGLQVNELKNELDDRVKKEHVVQTDKATPKKKECVPSAEPKQEKNLPTPSSSAVTNTPLIYDRALMNTFYRTPTYFHCNFCMKEGFDWFTFTSHPMWGANGRIICPTWNARYANIYGSPYV